ncbi:MAG: hypothetical protein HZA48_01645 [Planctomycetes bacterium]|nr:hypothetical protein [Planctomycetota bacterium]
MSSDDFKEFISQPEKKSCYIGTACFFTMAHLVLMAIFAALMLYWVPKTRQVFIELRVPLPGFTRLILYLSQLGWTLTASLFVAISGIDGIVMYLSSRDTENYKGISIAYLIIITVSLILAIGITYWGIFRPLQIIAEALA